MASHEVLCAVLSFLISKHGWGSPRRKQEIVAKTSIDPTKTDESEVKEAVEELRKEAPFIDDHGERGIAIDNSEFGLLAEYLFHECGWDPDVIRTRLKHYEGWERHDWT